MTPARSATGLAAIWAALLIIVGASFGCEDAAETFETSPPSLRVRGSNPCGGNQLARAETAEELTNRTMPTMTITVTGTDPNTPNGAFVNQTAVRLTTEGNEEDLPDGVSRLGAGRFFDSDEDNHTLTFAGRDVQTRFYCVRTGTVIINATVDSYRPGGTGEPITVRTLSTQSFRVNCVERDVYLQSCDVNGGDRDAGDGGPSTDAGDAGTDGGDAGDASDAAAPLPLSWSILYADPPASDLEISIRGNGSGRPDSVALIFAVVDRGTPLPNVPVSFEIVQEGGGGGNRNPLGTSLQPTETVETNADGLVSVRVYAGGTPGVISVRATAELEDRRESSRSPTITIRGNLPSMRGMHFSCAQAVVPAFSTRLLLDPSNWRVGLRPVTECSTQLADRAGGRVDATTRVFFSSEAGNVTQSASINEDGVATTTHWASTPVPVSTAVAEPCAPDGTCERGECEGGLCAPGPIAQDGMVRLIAVTRGEEDFDDLDGDGVFNPATDFFDPDRHDLGEPYIDANDNGRFDEGEYFRDLNGDGVWTPGNGVWDADTEIWKSTTVLWTGFLDEARSSVAVGQFGADGQFTEGLQGVPRNSACDGTPANIRSQRGEAFSLRGIFEDVNGNCLGANGEGTVRLLLPAGVVVINGFSEVSIRREWCFPDFEVARAKEFRWTLGVLPTAGGDPLVPVFDDVTVEVVYTSLDRDLIEVNTRRYTFSLCY